MTGLRMTPAEYKAYCARQGVAEAPEPERPSVAREIEAMQRRNLENRFLALWQRFGGPTDGMERDYRFDQPHSRMEFDFAWPALRLAVEVNGGQYKGAKSGHGSVRGLERDAKKIWAAQVKGWRLFVLTSSMVTADNVAELVCFAKGVQG